MTEKGLRILSQFYDYLDQADMVSKNGFQTIPTDLARRTLPYFVLAACERDRLAGAISLARCTIPDSTLKYSGLLDPWIDDMLLREPEGAEWPSKATRRVALARDCTTDGGNE